MSPNPFMDMLTLVGAITKAEIMVYGVTDEVFVVYTYRVQFYERDVENHQCR